MKKIQKSIVTQEVTNMIIIFPCKCPFTVVAMVLSKMIMFTIVGKWVRY